MSEKLIRFGGHAVRASEIEAVTQPLARVIAIVTTGGRHYLADYDLNRDADADLVRLRDEWDEWGAAQ